MLRPLDPAGPLPPTSYRLPSHTSRMLARTASRPHRVSRRETFGHRARPESLPILHPVSSCLPPRFANLSLLICSPGGAGCCRHGCPRRGVEPSSPVSTHGPALPHPFVCRSTHLSRSSQLSSTHLPWQQHSGHSSHRTAEMIDTDPHVAVAQQGQLSCTRSNRPRRRRFGIFGVDFSALGGQSRLLTLPTAPVP